MARKKPSKACSDAVSAMDVPLSWNAFRSLHKGQGFSRDEMAAKWKDYKDGLYTLSMDARVGVTPQHLDNGRSQSSTQDIADHGVSPDQQVAQRAGDSAASKLPVGCPSAQDVRDNSALRQPSAPSPSARDVRPQQRKRRVRRSGAGARVEAEGDFDAMRHNGLGGAVQNQSQQLTHIAASLLGHRLQERSHARVTGETGNLSPAAAHDVRAAQTEYCSSPVSPEKPSALVVSPCGVGPTDAVDTLDDDWVASRLLQGLSERALAERGIQHLAPNAAAEPAGEAGAFDGAMAGTAILAAEATGLAAVGEATADALAELVADTEAVDQVEAEPAGVRSTATSEVGEMPAWTTLEEAATLDGAQVAIASTAPPEVLAGAASAQAPLAVVGEGLLVALAESAAAEEALPDPPNPAAELTTTQEALAGAVMTAVGAEASAAGVPVEDEGDHALTTEADQLAAFGVGATRPAPDLYDEAVGGPQHAGTGEPAAGPAQGCDDRVSTSGPGSPAVCRNSTPRSLVVGAGGVELLHREAVNSSVIRAASGPRSPGGGDDEVFSSPQACSPGGRGGEWRHRGPGEDSCRGSDPDDDSCLGDASEQWASPAGTCSSSSGSGGGCCFCNGPEGPEEETASAGSPDAAPAPVRPHWAPGPCLCGSPQAAGEGPTSGTTPRRLIAVTAAAGATDVECARREVGVRVAEAEGRSTEDLNPEVGQHEPGSPGPGLEATAPQEADLLVVRAEDVDAKRLGADGDAAALRVQDAPTTRACPKAQEAGTGGDAFATGCPTAVDGLGRDSPMSRDQQGSHSRRHESEVQRPQTSPSATGPATYFSAPAASRSASPPSAASPNSGTAANAQSATSAAKAAVLVNLTASPAGPTRQPHPAGRAAASISLVSDDEDTAVGAGGTQQRRRREESETSLAQPASAATEPAGPSASGGRGTAGARRGRRGPNAWNRYQKQNAGRGLSISELRDEYRRSKATSQLQPQDSQGDLGRGGPGNSTAHRLLPSRRPTAAPRQSTVDSFLARDTNGASTHGDCPARRLRQQPPLALPLQQRPDRQEPVRFVAERLEDHSLPQQMKEEQQELPRKEEIQEKAPTSLGRQQPVDGCDRQRLLPLPQHSGHQQLTGALNDNSAADAPEGRCAPDAALSELPAAPASPTRSSSASWLVGLTVRTAAAIPTRTSDPFEDDLMASQTEQTHSAASSAAGFGTAEGTRKGKALGPSLSSAVKNHSITSSQPSMPMPLPGQFTSPYLAESAPSAAVRTSSVSYCTAPAITAAGTPRRSLRGVVRGLQQQQQPYSFRQLREHVDDSHPLLAGFTQWALVRPDLLKAVRPPAKPGIYEWGARPPGGSRVHAFYLGKAGGGGSKETLRSRFSKYGASTRLMLGPVTALRAAELAARGPTKKEAAAARRRAAKAAAKASDGAASGGTGADAAPGAAAPRIVGELRKAELWRQLQARGFELYYRYRVCLSSRHTSSAPSDVSSTQADSDPAGHPRDAAAEGQDAVAAERALHDQFDYAACLVNNGSYRELVLHGPMSHVTDYPVTRPKLEGPEAWTCESTRPQPTGPAGATRGWLRRAAAAAAEAEMEVVTLGAAAGISMVGAGRLQGGVLHVKKEPKGPAPLPA